MNERRQSPEIIALIVLFLAITAFTVIGFFREWSPPVASEHGAGVDRVIVYLMITTGALLVTGTVVFVTFLWHYGRGRPTASPVTTARTERMWSLAPVIVMALIAEVGVLVLGFPVWRMVYGEVPDNALHVEVIAQQFEWIARYPGQDEQFGRTDPHLVDQTTNPAGLDPDDPASADDIVLRNRLHVPVDRAVAVRLRSRDVLHSFSIPSFRVKQDVVPGMTGRTLFVPTEPGVYEIGCAELCGMGHYRMRGRVFVQTEEEFATWLSAQTGWFQ